MRVCLIGSQERARLLQTWASSGVEVRAKPRSKPPAVVNSPHDAYVAAPEVLDLVLEASHEGYDAIIMNCFLDIGIDAARALVRIPVVGQGESAMLVAASLGHRFSVITGLNSLVNPVRSNGRAVGVDYKLASVRALGLTVEEIREGGERIFQRLWAVAEETVERDGADTIVLGCASLSMLSEPLQEVLEVPVVNCLRTSLKMAELLVHSRLVHSREVYVPVISSLET